ncbi:MAG: RodZ domain-containing protein, partial [Olsenella profusa]
TDQTSTEPTEVEVSVASGGVSWVEIKCDGKSVMAQQVTGPWDQSYTVTQSITIHVSNVSVVTVSKNGETQSFETKASGLGTITIQGTPASTDGLGSGTGSSSDSSKGTSGGSGGSGGSNGSSSSGTSGKGSSSSSSTGGSTNGKGTTSNSGSPGATGKKS